MRPRWTIFGVFFGGLSFPGAVSIIGPTQYDNNNKYFKLNSDSIYAEANYDIVPDELKLTVGGRFTHDVKHFESRQTLFVANTIFPLGAGFFTSGSTNSLGLTDALYDAILPMATPRTKTSDYLSGHAILKWSPKLDFTDQTQVYLSLSHGARPGGFNPPSFSGLFKDTFGSEFVDAIELGSKNALFDNTVVANVTLWAYSYRGYQISKIIDRTSVQSNINTRLWGAEGEFFWTPMDQLQLNMNVGYNGSEIGNSTSFDTRNPSQGMPGATVVKDWLGSNCTIFSGTGLPGSAPTPSTPGFVGILADGPVTGALVGDNGVQIAEHVSYLDNATSGLSCGTSLNNYLTAYNLAHGTNYSSSSGVEANLHGKKMQNTPPVTLNVGVQYTFMIDGDYTLVPRFDIYWKDASWASIFNAPTDRIPDWYTANAQMQFNAPDYQWYVRGWVTNLFDGKQVTGFLRHRWIGPLHQPVRGRAQNLRYYRGRALLSVPRQPKNRAPGNRRPFSLR